MKKSGSAIPTRRVFLDIETLPADEQTRLLMKDQSEANWLKTSLSPFYGRVYCVGVGREFATFGRVTRLELTAYIGDGTRPSEAAVIHKAGIDIIGSQTIHTWNGAEFDLPFLRNRAVILGGTQAQVGQWTHIPPENHLDLRSWWHQDKPYGPTIVGHVGLQQVALLLGLQGKSGHGSNVYPMFLRGEHAAVAQYCLDDVLLTWQVYNRTINGEVPEVEIERTVIPT